MIQTLQRIIPNQILEEHHQYRMLRKLQSMFETIYIEFSKIQNYTQKSNYQVQFYDELKSDKNRSPSYHRGRNQAKLADLCSEDKQKIGQMLSKLTQEAEEKKQIYEQLIKTQSEYEEKVEKMRKSSHDIYQESKNLRKEYKDTMKYLEESSNLVNFIQQLNLNILKTFKFKIEVIHCNFNKNSIFKYSQKNLGNLDPRMSGNENNKKTFDLINQVKYQSLEQNNIQNKFLRESDDFQLSQNKPNSFYKHIITEESDIKGNDALKLSDIISSGKFQEGQLLKYSQNSNFIKQGNAYNNQEMDKNKQKSMQKNHSVHIHNIPEYKNTDRNEYIQNQPSSVRQRILSSGDFQKSHQENTNQTSQSSQSQNELKESKISTKKREIVQLKDEIENLAQSLRCMGKRGRRSTKEGETPSKNKSTAQEDSKFVSPNFKPLINTSEQQIDEEIKKHKQSEQTSSSLIQYTEQEQETFYFKENKENRFKEDEFKFNKINNILFNEVNAEQIQSCANKKSRQNKSFTRDNMIEDAKSDILKQKRLIEQLQIRQSQLQFEDNGLDQDLDSIEDSELKLSNLRINNSFQSTHRNPIMSCSNSKQKERDDKQKMNSYNTQSSTSRNKESVKNLIDKLSTEEISQIKQHIDQKLSSKGSTQINKQLNQFESQYGKQSQYEQEKQQKNKSQSPFSSKIKQFMQIKDRIIGENKSLKQQDLSKYSDEIKNKEETPQQNETNQNIKKKLYNEFKTVQNDEIQDNSQYQKQQQFKQNQTKSSNTLGNHSLHQNSNYFSDQNQKKYFKDYLDSDNMNQNNMNAFMNEYHRQQTNSERDQLGYNLQRQEKNQEQMKKNKNSQSMVNYQLDILERNQTQKEQFNNKKISQNKYDIQKQQISLQYENSIPSYNNDSKNCFDTFCMNESINNRSFQQQQQQKPIKNENILDFYHQEQQKQYQQNWQQQQINQLQDYQNFQKNSNLHIDQQNTLKQFQQPYLDSNYFPTSQTSSNKHQVTLQKQSQQQTYDSINQKKQDQNMKENQQKYSNQSQYQTKKIECDEFEDEILDLLNDGQNRKKADKSPQNKTQPYKKPKSLERQAHHNQFMQNFLMSNESTTETKELLNRYNKLVGQISEKLKSKDIENKNQSQQNKNQSKQNNKNNKSSFRF